MSTNSKTSLNSSKLLQNYNLLRVIINFCSVEDLLSLSLVNKTFFSVVKFFDYKFIDYIEKEYFSEYSNYNYCFCL